MNFEIKVNEKSHFNIIKRDSAGNEIYRSHDMHNTMTNRAYRLLFGGTGLVKISETGSNWPNNYRELRYIYLGTGNVELNRADNGLTNPIDIRDGQSGSKPHYPVSDIVNIGGKDYCKITAYYVWPMGSLDNVTFSEIGLFSSNTGNNTMMCGQLLKDASGNPTSITILDDEQLIVKYTSYWPYFPIRTVLGSKLLNLGGVDHTVTLLSGESNPGQYHNPETGSWNVRVLESTVGSPNSNHANAGNSVHVRELLSDRVNWTISVTANLNPVNHPIGSMRIERNKGSPTPTYYLRFDPPLPKNDENMIKFDVVITTIWGE